VNKRIVLLASGTGSLAEAVMDAKIPGTEIVSLISDRDAPVIDKASARGINTELISFKSSPSREEWDERIINAVEKLNPDLVVSVGFMRVLPAKFVHQFKTINTHPALLPHFPGAHAVRDALAAGVAVTGSTVHWVDEGVDTGKIIRQREVEIYQGDTEESLHERIKIVERTLIVETLVEYSLNKLKVV
jgi:phosphoribosylglycinamide formyltransferase-1